MNKTSVEFLFLSRLTWIQERLKWWRPHLGLASTQPFNFQVFIKRDEIQEEESILTTARVLTRASLQQWRVEQTVVHFSSIQVSRNGPFHNHKSHWASLFTLWKSDVNDLYTWQLMLCEPKWTFSMCVLTRLYCGKLLYWFKGGPMIPWPVRYFLVEAVNCLWNQGSCTDKSWLWVSRSVLDASGHSERVFEVAVHDGQLCWVWRAWDALNKNGFERSVSTYRFFCSWNLRLPSCMWWTLARFSNTGFQIRMPSSCTSCL